jgi:ADP-ribosyl-[dinitrogen reductase] hydrolase
MSAPAALPPLPLRNSYWVVPGLLLAGEHPDGNTRDKTRDRLKKLLGVGIECFIDLTKPTELLRYDVHLPFYVEYVRKPIKDHGLPGSRAQMVEILDHIGNAMRAGRPVYVHCRAGIGRTGTVVGCLLVERGLTGDGALDELNRLWQQCKRSKSWPTVPETDQQATYVREWTPGAAGGGFDMTATAAAISAVGPMSATAGQPLSGGTTFAAIQARAAMQSTGAGQARATTDRLAAGKLTVGFWDPVAGRADRDSLGVGEARDGQTQGGQSALGAPRDGPPAVAESRASESRAGQLSAGAARDGRSNGRQSAVGELPDGQPRDRPRAAGESYLDQLRASYQTPVAAAGAATDASSPPPPQQQSQQQVPSARPPEPPNMRTPQQAPSTPSPEPWEMRAPAAPNAGLPEAPDTHPPPHAPSTRSPEAQDMRAPAAPNARPPHAANTSAVDSDPLLDPGTLSAARGLRDRFIGALYGLAVGDAVAAATQYRRPGSFSPIGDMIGGGPFDLPRGGWSDDTAMSLCLAESLLECNGFDARDQVQRYTRWQQAGYLSATGQCVGITANTARALAMAQWRRVVFAGSHDPDQQDPEPLSRIAPVVLYFFASLDAVVQQAADSSRTTCQAPTVLESCRRLARALHAGLSGLPKNKILAEIQPSGESATHANATAATALAGAFWAFATTDNFRDAILRAANVGGNSDVVAAVCGQLAGAHYGVSAIPPAWRNSLMQKDLIEAFADRLLAHGLVTLGG